MVDTKNCPKDADEIPPKCPKCGKFMKTQLWIGENSNECEEYTCVCGHREVYQ